MPLDLDLLPDKPKTYTNIKSQDFRLNLDLLPDKPQKYLLQQPRPPAEIRAISPKSIYPQPSLTFTPEEFQRRIERDVDRMATLATGKSPEQLLQEKRRLELVTSRALPLATAMGGAPLAALGFEAMTQAKNIIVPRIKKERYSPLERRMLSELIPEKAPTPLKIGAMIGENIADIVLLSSLTNLAKRGLLEKTIKEVGVKLEKAGYGTEKVPITKEAIREAAKGTTLEREIERFSQVKGIKVPPKLEKITSPEMGISPWVRTPPIPPQPTPETPTTAITSVLTPQPPITPKVSPVSPVIPQQRYIQNIVEKVIPKELETLAQEVKEYKTAEEFTQAIYNNQIKSVAKAPIGMTQMVNVAPLVQTAGFKSIVDFFNQVTRKTQEKIKPPLPTEELKPKIIPVKKTLQILPRKEQLLTQIQEAIQKAPAIPMPTPPKEKASFTKETYPQYQKELAEYITDVKKKFGTISFQVDGGAEIINTKESLQKFYDAIKSTAKTMPTTVAEEKVSIPRAVAGKQEKIDELAKTPKGYFTDGKLIIKGEPPPKAKFNERVVEKESLDNFLQEKTQPAQKLYYFIDSPETKGVSAAPIGKTVTEKPDEYIPKVVFLSEGKYYTYDQFRFNAINNRFPNADYGIDNNGYLIAYVNKKPVAVLLSMQYETFNIPPLGNEAVEAGLIKPPSPSTTEQPQPTGKGGGKAFAMPLGGLEEWIKHTQEQNIQLKPLEMPELVKLAVELMGKYPVVKKLVTNLGLFKFGKGIALDVKIFKDPHIAGIVLAHEIGHLIDWLPDYTLARGNLLGRIATLKYYMKSLLAEKPGMEGTVLTPKDRERLRRVAEQELKAEAKLGEREIIEEIIKEIPIYAESKITLDEILSIWREQATTIKETNPTLYEFIAKLSSAQKKSIIKQAMQGIIDERILQMQGGKRIGTRIVKEQVRRVITPVAITPENIRVRFKKLLKDEIIKRKLFENEVIKEELKRITQWWNPFDDTVKGWYTSYRYGSDELYAEAISVMLNKPEKIEELAPQFYKAFWNYIDRKPEVKAALLELQDFLNMGEGEKLRVRREDVYSIFKKGEEIFFEKRNEYKLNKKSLWYKLKTELLSKNIPVLEKMEEARKQGKIIKPEDNPQYALEEYTRSGGKLMNDIEVIQKEIRDVLEENGMTDENLGEYLFFKRVTTERADIANPLGHNRETAQRQLDYLQSVLENEKFEILKTLVGKVRAKLETLLLEADENGLYKPGLIQELITNKDYAPFQILDYLNDYVTTAVIKQIGTLKPIANPFTSIVLKMISLRKAIERVKTNNSVIKFMQTDFPAEILPAKIRHLGKFKDEIVEKEGFGVIKTRINGKLAGYYVDPFITDVVEYHTLSKTNAILSILKFLKSSYFRPVYISWNLSYQSYNLLRDFFSFWSYKDKNMPFYKIFEYYWKAIPSVKKKVWGNISDETIREMQQHGMLGLTYGDMFGGDKDDVTEIEYLMNKYNALKTTPDNPILKVLNFLDELSRFIEMLPKTAGYLARLKSDRPIQEIAHEVRVFAGSPDFYDMGAGKDWFNNVFIFGNAFVQDGRRFYEGAFKNPRTRSGFWWKTVITSFLPKILMFLGMAGYFGQRIKENYEKQTEFNKTNYNTFPLGITENNDAIYFRMPNDEIGRFFGALFWKALNFDKDNIMQSLGHIASLTGGQLPSLAPEIEIMSAVIQYATGKNPYDFFRGRDILTNDERLAGGWYSLKPMLKWVGGKLGIYGFSIYAQREDAPVWEKVIQWTPIIQRFIKVTSYGEKEKQGKEEMDWKQFQARMRLNIRNMK